MTLSDFKEEYVVNSPRQSLSIKDIVDPGVAHFSKF